MFEIALLSFVLVASMAKHGRRYPRKGRYSLRRVRISANSAIGALAALDVITNAVIAGAGDTYRLISVDCSYALIDSTVADDGQSFGLAHSDYTAAEIEECLEATTAIDLGDKVAQEKANRLVRMIGTFAPGSDAGEQFNDGKRVKVRLNWKMSIGDTITLWIRNSSSTIYTTGALISMNGDLWLKDSV